MTPIYSVIEPGSTFLCPVCGEPLTAPEMDATQFAREARARCLPLTWRIVHLPATTAPVGQYTRAWPEGSHTVDLHIAMTAHVNGGMGPTCVWALKTGEMSD